MKRSLRFVIALVAGIATTASAQVLDIEIANGVFYVYDTTDLSKFVTSPAVVCSAARCQARSNVAVRPVSFGLPVYVSQRSYADLGRALAAFPTPL